MGPLEFQIRPLATHADFRACVALQKSTWGEGFSELVPPAILMVAGRLGGVVAGAFAPDGRLLGFVFGITGWESGRAVHWSDMLAVVPEARNRGVGRALKLHQRDELLARGVETVYWTFDPLEARNAHVNFARLGVTAHEYHPDLYGATDSPLHAGIGTDRLVAVWELASSRVADRIAGRRPAPSVSELSDVPRVLAARPTRGLVAPVVHREESRPPRVRISVPASIQEIKDRSPDLARAWRDATREAFLAFLDQGYRVVELVRDGELGWYVLERRGEGREEG